MKTTLISIVLIISFNHAQAAQKAKSKLSTDIKFDGHMVAGKMQAPFESLTEVENEKLIDQLIGSRSNFNDRIYRSNELR